MEAYVMCLTSSYNHAWLRLAVYGKQIVHAVGKRFWYENWKHKSSLIQNYIVLEPNIVLLAHKFCQVRNDIAYR